MIQPGRSGAPRRGVRAPGQAALGVLVLLAVGGSVVMVFSESAQLLRLAVVALLWVAVVCSIAVTKYRREAVTSEIRARELQKVYELELEREINARRERELLVERDLREQVHAQSRAESSDDLAGLREEVKALRESLSELFNGDFLIERVALRAESTRVRALADDSVLTHNDSVLTHNDSVLTHNDSVLTHNDSDELVVAEDDRIVDVETDEQAPPDPGAHSAGRSVAELIAAYGGALSGRRRRRSAD